jgi:hypothetical protein
MGAVLGRDGGTDESMFPQFGITRHWLNPSICWSSSSPMSALLELVRCEHHRLDLGTKALPRHETINAFERIAPRRQGFQALIGIENLSSPSPLQIKTSRIRASDSHRSGQAALRRAVEHPWQFSANEGKSWLKSLLLRVPGYRPELQFLREHPWPARTWECLE